MSRRYIPALIIVLVLIGATIYLYDKESTYISGMSIATGKVVALGSKSTSSMSIPGKTTTRNTQAIVAFTVSGTSYRSEGRAFGYPDWKIGQTVEVYYSAANPKMSRIKRFAEVYFFSLVSAFFLSACIVFGAINYVVYKIRGRPLS